MVIVMILSCDCYNYDLVMIIITVVNYCDYS